MKSLLHSLEGSETALLMYLFDELPADDRAEVESMLRTDGGLRAQFQRLQATYGCVNDAIAAADKDTDKRTRSVQVAERNAVKLLNQWKVHQVIHRPVPVPAGPIRKWVLYPAGGVAAALIIGLILWGMFGPTPKPHIDPLVADDDSAQRDMLVDVEKSFESELAEEDDAVIDPGTEDMLVRSLDTSDDMLRDAQNHRHIRDVERQLVAITLLTEDQDQLR